MGKKNVTRNTDIWNTATLYYFHVKSIEQFEFVKLQLDETCQKKMCCALRNEALRQGLSNNSRQKLYI